MFKLHRIIDLKKAAVEEMVHSRNNTAEVPKYSIDGIICLFYFIFFFCVCIKIKYKKNKKITKNILKKKC